VINRTTSDPVTEECLRMIFGGPVPSVLTQFAAYWLGKRHGRLMPAMADLDPLEMPWALPHIFIVARNQQGRFAYQLVGDAMNSRFGGGMKGKTAYDVFEPDYARKTEERWEATVTHVRTYFRKSFHHSSDNRPVWASRISFPVSEDGVVPNKIVGVAHFLELNKSMRDDPNPDISRWTAVDQLPA